MGCAAGSVSLINLGAECHLRRAPTRSRWPFGGRRCADPMRHDPRPGPETVSRSRSPTSLVNNLNPAKLIPPPIAAGRPGARDPAGVECDPAASWLAPVGLVALDQAFHLSKATLAVLELLAGCVDPLSVCIKGRTSLPARFHRSDQFFQPISFGLVPIDELINSSHCSPSLLRRLIV